MRNQTMKSWNSAAQCVLGCIVLALVTLACVWLALGPAPTALAYLIAIVLLSLMSSFLVSAVLSLVAVAGLNYFSVAPIFNFRIEHPSDLVLLIAFLLASLTTTRLMGSSRRQVEAARQGQAKAEQAERELRRAVDAIPALVWSAQPDGSRDFHSQRWLEFTGLSADEGGGEGWIAALHPQDRGAVTDKWRSAIATGEPFEVETRGRSANGEYRWFLVRAEPLRDERGTIVKWYGSNTDIEDRKRAITALRDRETQWREVFEHNPVMYFMVDATGTILSVNTFGAAQLGYSVGELLGQSVLNVFFEEDRGLVQKNVALCLENIGQTHSWEIRKVRKDGSALWVRENAKAVRRLDNQLIVLVVCEDITERKETENALRRSETYLAEAQRLSHTGSFGWRIATGEIIWSDETFRIFGYDKVPSVTFDMVVQRIHPDDRAIAQQTIDRASSDGADFDHGYRLLMPDGSVKYVHAVARAVKDASDGIAFVGAVTDVTARKRAEEELHEAQANLAHVTRVTALGELTASIAHEVNQPLAAVVTHAAACRRWLDRETPNLDEARNALELIINDGNRAGEVIRRVGALVNKTATQKVPLDINDVVNEVATLMQHELFSRRVSLRLELAPALPVVLVDRIQLQQVILNLVINGIEAMQPVTDRPRELVIRTHQGEAHQVLVTVKDCGVGIATENADRLFNAFFTTKSSGMGMGLAICRSIVDAHGGRLAASGNAGPGATFQFSLPLHQEDNAS